MLTCTTQCSSELYNQQNILLCFFHLALWYNYATWTNEMQTFQINTLIQFFNFWHFLHVSNCPQNEPLRFETCRRRQTLNQSINLKSVHFVGSCCIRIIWHYGQREQTSPLFDDSYKGTCPSHLAGVLSGRHNTHLAVVLSGRHNTHLAVVLSGRHNTHLVSLPSMSVTH